MIVLEHYIVLSSLIFMIGMMGLVLNRNNLIGILMCMELMLLAVNIQLIAADRYLGSLDGQIAVFFILAVAAAEAVIGLAIFIILYQRHRSIKTEVFSQLRG